MYFQYHCNPQLSTLYIHRIDMVMGQQMGQLVPGGKFTAPHDQCAAPVCVQVNMNVSGHPTPTPAFATCPPVLLGFKSTT